MCLAIPGRVVRIKRDIATISYGKERREAKIADISVSKGDYVLVQFGYVTQKLKKKDALKSLEAWKSLWKDS